MIASPPLEGWIHNATKTKKQRKKNAIKGNCAEKSQKKPAKRTASKAPEVFKSHKCWTSCNAAGCPPFRGL